MVKLNCPRVPIPRSHRRPDATAVWKQADWERYHSSQRFVDALFCYLGAPSHILWCVGGWVGCGGWRLPPRGECPTSLAVPC